MMCLLFLSSLNILNYLSPLFSVILFFLKILIAKTSLLQEFYAFTTTPKTPFPNFSIILYFCPMTLSTTTLKYPESSVMSSPSFFSLNFQRSSSSSSNISMSYYSILFFSFFISLNCFQTISFFFYKFFSLLLLLLLDLFLLLPSSSSLRIISFIFIIVIKIQFIDECCIYIIQSELSSDMTKRGQSFLSQDTIEEEKQIKKQSQQFKALFLKNVKLQSKQIGTNLCQIFTPIVCILFTYLMQKIASQNMPLGALYEPVEYPYKFNNFTKFDDVNPSRNALQWFLYECQNVECDKDILGINNGTAREGLLGSIPASYPINVVFHPDPFNNIDETQNMEVAFWMLNNETSINKNIYDRVVRIGDADIDIVNAGGLDALPDAAFDIQKLNNESLEFDVKINDVRDLQSHRSNGLTRMKQLRTIKDTDITVPLKTYTPPYGLLSVIDTLTAAFIQKISNITVESGYVLMPDLDDGVTFVDTIIGFVSVLVFPISLSLLFPVYLYTVVLEKQQKLIQMMKMNGMKISSYWFVYFIFNLILGLITNIVFFLFGYFLLGNRFFTQTSFALLFFVLLGWILAQIGLAVFFQTFLSTARSANIIGYLISIWTCMIGSTLNIGVYQFPAPYPIGLQMFSPFGFVRIIYLMLTTCSDGECYGSISNIPDEMKQCIAFLYLNFIFFFLVGAYLFEIIPQEFGVTRSIFFPFTMTYQFFKRCFGQERKVGAQEISSDPQLRQYINKNQEDNYAKEERQNLLNEEGNLSDYPLIVNNLRKLYRKPGYEGMYAAVRSFNLKIQKKQTFGLLGPNGAGKTTLISMITGMFQPNYGNAWIGGYSIRNTLEKAQLQMGVCPQFDLLWPQLSVEEHLYFYARLKGIPSHQIQRKVNSALQDVNLTKFRTFPSSSLSGGMRRRLSVAISLVGDPQIVFLDEPSTGLDPDNRRQLWQVLSKCQKKRAIMLTTHMMQEADTLCNRVGIITNGTLRTVSSQNNLKNAYGGGYRMTISLTKEEKLLVNRESLNMMEEGNDVADYEGIQGEQENNEIKKSIDSFVEVQDKQQKIKMQKKIQVLNKFMAKWFPESVLFKSFNGCLIYKVPLNYKVSEMLQTVQKLQKQLDIADVAITNSSLQDVFMNVVIKFEKPFQKKQNQEQVQQFYSFPSNSVDIPPVEPQMKESSIISKKRESVMSQPEQKPESDEK